MVDPIPEGYPRLMAYLTPSNAAQAIEFYRDAFGATERTRMEAPGGKIGHAEVALGDSVLMLADEPDDPSIGYQSPSTLGGTSFGFVLYVEDVDAVFKRAVDAGARPVSEPETQFYGDREGRVQDPFGYVWSLMAHVEDVSPEEMERRMEQAYASGGEAQ